jgi:hypothetical protein
MKLLDLTFPNLGDVQSGRLGTPTALLHHVTRKKKAADTPLNAAIGF